MCSCTHPVRSCSFIVGMHGLQVCPACTACRYARHARLAGMPGMHGLQVCPARTACRYAWHAALLWAGHAALLRPGTQQEPPGREHHKACLRLCPSPLTSDNLMDKCLYTYPRNGLVTISEHGRSVPCRQHYPPMPAELTEMNEISRPRSKCGFHEASCSTQGSGVRPLLQKWRRAGPL